MISQEKSFDKVTAWLDHPFGNYLLSGKFADGILRVSIKQGTYLDIPIHRIILASKSPWFDHLFTCPPFLHRSDSISSSLPIWHIQITKDQESAIQTCIEFSYLSKARLDFENWAPVLQLAVQFQLDGLAKLARNYAKEFLHHPFFSNLNLDQWAQLLWSIVQSLLSRGKIGKVEEEAGEEGLQVFLDRAVQSTQKELDGICVHLKIKNARYGFRKYLVILSILQIQKDLQEIETEKSKMITKYLVDLIDVHDWSEKEVSWGLEDKVADSDALLHRLESLQIESIDSHSLGFEKDSRLESEVLKEKESRESELLELMERQSTTTDPDRTIKQFDYICKSKEKEKSWKDGQHAQDGQVDQVGDVVRHDEETKSKGDLVNLLVEEKERESLMEMEQNRNSIEMKFELEKVQRERSSSAETLPEKTIWDQYPTSTNQTCIYAPKPQRSNIKPPDFISNEKLLEFMQDTENEEEIHGVSFASSHIKAGNLNQEYHNLDGGLLPPIPYPPESETSLVDDIRQSFPFEKNNLAKEIEYPRYDQPKPVLQYSVYSGDTNSQSHIPYSIQATPLVEESLHQTQPFHSVNNSLDRDSTPKATLLNHQTAARTHSRYYSEAQYSSTATIGSSQSSTATIRSGIRSIHPVSTLPDLPSLRSTNSKLFFRKKPRTMSFFSMIPNHKRGMKSYDLEKQHRSSWNYEVSDGVDEGESGRFELDQGLNQQSQRDKKKSLVDYLKVLF